MLVGAFLSTQQNSISLSRYSQEKRICRDVSESLAQACRFQLERQRTWGLVPGHADDALEFRDAAGHVTLKLTPIGVDEAGAPEFVGMTGRAFFKGEAPKVGVDIRVTVVNNLENPNEDEAMGVGAKSCRLQFRTGLARFSERIEISLRRAAFFDSTVVAAKDINIAATKITFSSRDPLRNQIRSLENIQLPNIQLPDGEDGIVFEPSEDSLTTEKGTVWAKGLIAVAPEVIPPGSSLDRLEAVAEHTQGEFLPEAPSHFSVPNLEWGDVDFDDTTTETLIGPGDFRFGNLRVRVKGADGVWYPRFAPSLTVDDGTGGDPSHYYYKSPELFALPPNVEDPDFFENASVELMDPEPPNATLIDGPACRFCNIDFDLKERTATVDALAKNRSLGSLSISGGSLVFFAPEPSSPDEPPARGHLSVEGSFRMEGPILNCGKLLASGDVELSPQDLIIENLDEAEDIAVFAGKKVTISPPPSGDGDFINASNRSFVFRGLVYAGKDFLFSSTFQSQGQEVPYQRQLYVEGALISKTGRVTVNSNKGVELKYNRDYLDDLLENPDPEERKILQIEEVSWRTF